MLHNVTHSFNIQILICNFIQPDTIKEQNNQSQCALRKAPKHNTYTNYREHKIKVHKHMY